MSSLMAEPILFQPVGRHVEVHPSQQKLVSPTAKRLAIAKMGDISLLSTSKESTFSKAAVFKETVARKKVILWKEAQREVRQH